MKKKKNTIPYRNINDLPEDDWIRNLGPMIIYSVPLMESVKKARGSSEVQKKNPHKEKPSDSDL